MTIEKGLRREKGTVAEKKRRRRFVMLDHFLPGIIEAFDYWFNWSN